MESKGMKIVKFFREHCEFHQGGQGVIGITCNKLWEMKDEEFDNLFAIVEEGVGVMDIHFPTSTCTCKKCCPRELCECNHSKSKHNVEYGTGHNVKVGNIGCDECDCKKFQIEN